MQKLLLFFLLSATLFAQEIHYTSSYEDALALAKKEHKPLMLFMTQDGCVASKFIIDKVISDQRTTRFINKNYIIAKLDVHNNKAPKRFQVKMTPTFHFITPEEKKFRPSIIGAKNIDDFYTLVVEAKNTEYFNATVLKGAPNNKAILVRDTDSALGRYKLQAKPFTLDALSQAHGHLCSDLVLAYVLIRGGLNSLFDNGVVDRTDIKILSRNSPALVDAAALMTGARINFNTLFLQNSLGLDFIIHRISTNQSVRVSLQNPSFLNELTAKKRFIKKTRYHGKNVSAQDIDEYEALEKVVIQKLLYDDVQDLLEIEQEDEFRYALSTKEFSKRSDTINKNMPR